MQNLLFLVFSLFLPVIANAAWFQTTDQQAFSAFQQQHYDEAAQLFSDPYQQGVSLYRAGKYPDAERAFSQVTQPDKQADAQYNLGNVYFQQKQYDKAVSAYQNALKLGGNRADVIHNLQVTQKQLQRQQQQNQQQNKQENQQDNHKNADNPKDQQGTDKNSSDAKSKPQQQNGSQSSQQAAQNKPDASKNPHDPNASQSDTSQNSPKTAQSKPTPSESQKNTTMADKSDKNQSSDDDKNTKDAVVPPTVKPQLLQPNDNKDKSVAQQASSQKSPESAAQQSAQSASATQSAQAQQDMLADAYLNQVEENSQQLLRNQFKIDQWVAQQKSVDAPTQNW
jgi:Ca-activated chloride channel family protein